MLNSASGTLTSLWIYIIFCYSATSTYREYSLWKKYRKVQWSSSASSSISTTYFRTVLL